MKAFVLGAELYAQWEIVLASDFPHTVWRAGVLINFLPTFRGAWQRLWFALEPISEELEKEIKFRKLTRCRLVLGS